MEPGNMVACIFDARDEGCFSSCASGAFRPPKIAANQKNAKSVAKPRNVPRRGQERRRFESFSVETGAAFRVQSPALGEGELLA
jgi:hypothetical protein